VGVELTTHFTLWVLDFTSIFVRLTSSIDAAKTVLIGQPYV